MEQHSDPGTHNRAQNDRRGSEQNQEDGNTCDRIKNQRIAPTDSDKSDSRFEPQSSVRTSIRALKRQDISVIFNESSIVLTKPMVNLLKTRYNPNIS